MMRVTFDPYYVDDLQDYYRRNECIREQQYLSPEKLLHLAAFCVSKAAKDGDAETEQHGIGPDREVALDVVRQLSVLCDDADLEHAQREPVTVVKGETLKERQNNAAQSTTAIVPKVGVRDLRLRRMGSALFYPVAWLFGCESSHSRNVRPCGER
jgi:hypothetical protein